MVFTKAGRVNEAEIEAGVRKVEKEFAPEVVRIGYTFGEDALDEPAVFFRVLVTDETFVPIRRLTELSHRLSRALVNDAMVFENGLGPYFFFRSVSEQERRRDPEWN